MKKGLLVVLSGPSGVGKGTIYSELLKRLQNLSVSVSVTTRAPRVGEIDGVHYYFVTDKKFDEMLEGGLLLESALTVGNRYGTPKEPVIKKLSEGVDVLLEIDIKGARQVKQAYTDAVTIFVLPPDEEELFRRLKGRGTENEEQISARFELARSEIAQCGEFDYNVVNAELDVAVNEVIEIMEKEKRSRNIC